MVRSADGPVSAALRTGLHLLFVSLALFVMIRAAFREGPEPIIAAALAAAFLIWYLLGAWWGRADQRGSRIVMWLSVLTLLWIGMILVSQDAAYLSFPLFFLFLALLERTAALLCVALTSAVSIVAIGLHGGFSAPGIIGPLIGAVIAVAIGLGYRELQREAARREALIEELISTRVRLAETEREAGKLAERERLARDIHDTVAQGLASIGLLLHAAERAAETDPATAVTHVRRARDAAALALTETRGLIDELAPPAITGASLAEALTRLAENTAQQAGIVVEFHTDGEPEPLSTVVKTGLLRIGQSALANVVQHAGATRADISLSYLPGETILDIVDNGCGFDPADLGERTVGGSFGIVAMRARIAELGGTLVVESTPGDGTTVTVRFTGEGA
ncbi:sensor histidine kinase [Mycetocola tolaasinivorans]|uniref:Sensor histidine kinase n=1 Tax=Mycetocola tolaasinivorans TaxID=76635 RepID=A0A3L7A6C5_9MICO|nr:sensor histidine kinase [Mycetocola tolaasinivorans]RLP75625.1 sensor histidine kinase [Mycetocola tolaasinivorans]